MSTIKIKPLGDRAVVKPLSEDVKTAGGIILPDTVKERPTKGTVIAIGEGMIANSGTIIKPRVKVDDIVLYGRNAGSEIELNGEKFLIMREQDIYGILENINDTGA